MSNFQSDPRAVILKDGVPFTTWSSDLRGALAQEALVGYVFHDHPGIRVKKAPIKPEKADEDSKPYEKYLDQLEKWTMMDLKACSIILRRLDPSIRPESNQLQTSFELYNMIAETHRPSVSLPYRTSYKNLLSTKFRTTATDYCNKFQRNLQNFRNAASNLESLNKTRKYGITDGMSSIMFFEGTSHVNWLETLRATGAMNRDQNLFASLEQMMSTLRAVSGERHLTPSTAIAAAAQRNCDPKDQCHIHPTLSHTNEECRAQNPELRAKKNKRGKLSGQKGRVNAAILFEESDSDDFSVAMTALPSSLKVAASVSGLEISKDTLIWDSGASNHFINDRQAFTQLTKLAKPFSFDQAVTKSTLNYGGTARIKVGNLKLTLSEALYSPNSSMNLISAGRAYRLTGISEDREKSMLVKLIRGKQCPLEFGSLEFIVLL